MDRYETRIDDGTFRVEGKSGWIDIGSLDEILEKLGETYEVEYNEIEQAHPWIETDEGVLEINVPETLREISYDDEFVDLLEGTPPDQRVPFFAEMMRQIWDSKGSLDEYED